jgi:hypothetical protein
MSGDMHIIDSFDDGSVNALVGEEFYSFSPETDRLIYHEITLMVGKAVLGLQLHDIESVLTVLKQAQEAATARRRWFYSQEDYYAQTA